MFLALASGVDTTIYGIMIVTSIAVSRKMKVSAEKMSAKTKTMQSQMNRLLITEVCDCRDSLIAVISLISGRLRHDNRCASGGGQHVHPGVQPHARRIW